jgi:hypothetical protein
MLIKRGRPDLDASTAKSAILSKGPLEPAEIRNIERKCVLYHEGDASTSRICACSCVVTETLLNLFGKVGYRPGQRTTMHLVEHSLGDSSNVGATYQSA